LLKRRIVMAKVMSLRLVSVILLAFMVFTCAGCATVRHPVPLEMVGKTQVENMPEIRTMTGSMNVELQKNAIKAF
jgi:hypothetical protein